MSTPGDPPMDVVRVGSLSDMATVATGLSLPEGPVALPDGDVLVTEIGRGTLTRVTPDGTLTVVGDCGGGPNGAAIGPDGAVYVCNNGGFPPTEYTGGRIERVDLDTGVVEVLYSEYEGRPLLAPNDLVFDSSGHFWFTDSGRRHHRQYDFGSIYYAAIDGSSIEEVIHPIYTPNGIGLSADGRTLYYAETVTGRLRQRTIDASGLVKTPGSDPHSDSRTMLCGLPGMQWFDSLAIDRDGNICVATLHSGRITVVSPDGSNVVQYLLPPGFEDSKPTNLCFSGPESRTVHITLIETSRLITCTWPESVFDGQV